MNCLLMLLEVFTIPRVRDATRLTLSNVPHVVLKRILPSIMEIHPVIWLSWLLFRIRNSMGDLSIYRFATVDMMRYSGLVHR